jgi:hypothetical protein
MRYGWSEFEVVQARDLALAAGQMLAEASQSLSNCTESVPSASVPIASRSKGFVLPKDNTITISIIGGPAKGQAHQLSKARISIGRAGGATDIEIDDPRVSVLHCAVAVSQNRIKLYDLDSTSGTFVNEERIETVELEHLSEFRVGSSLLLVLVLPKREPGIL